MPPKSRESNPTESSTMPSTLEVPLDDIVMHSSNMGDFVTPPWLLIKTRNGALSDAVWEDPQGYPKLTSRQSKRLSRWVRFIEKGKVKTFFSSTPNSDRIKQGFVADCSFLSCLATLADYENRYNIPLLTNIISLVVVNEDFENTDSISSDGLEPPLDTEPKIAIGVKIYFNGIARCVLVDDWVPVREDGRMLCAHSSDPSECWVTVLEKAFVKINGGTYTINGTNPGIDIYHLTGWIPDILPLPSTASMSNGGSVMVDRYDNKWDEVWDVMYGGFCSGSCVVCVGTGEIADAAPPELEYTEGISMSSGIVSDHAYSVLKLMDISMPDKSRVRLLYLNNPWRRVSWNKRFSPYDEESWTPELRQILKYNPNKDKDTGQFWIEWTDVLRWFSHLYISWKPNVFRNRTTLHHIWEPNPLFSDSVAPEDVYLSLFNPQFKISITFGKHDSATVWVMLLQHRKRTDEAPKYLALHVFSHKGPVVCPSLPDVQGIYNNGECILVKLLVKRKPCAELLSGHMLKGESIMAYETSNEASVLVLLSYYTQKIQEATPLTLKALSTRPVQITHRPCAVKPDWVVITDNGEWDDTNSGGSPNELWNYFMNPHYRLRFDEDTEAIVLLESSAQVSLNFRIFHGRLATFRSLKMGSTITSGEYKAYCCGVHQVFKAGEYVLIPSTFRRTDRAKYRIVIHSHKSCTLQRLPYPHANLSNVPDLHTIRMDINNSVYIKVDIPTLVSIKLKVPDGVMSDLFVMYASSSCAPHPTSKEGLCNYVAYDNTFCLGLSCNFCGGPSGMFRPLQHKDPTPDPAENYDLILYSDLNGGNSKSGRLLSASAKSLFQQTRTLNFTLVKLLPSKTPYKLTAVGMTTRGTITIVSDHPVTIV